MDRDEVLQKARRMLLESTAQTSSDKSTLIGYTIQPRLAHEVLSEICAALLASKQAQQEPKLTPCRHCGFRVALNESPVPENEPVSGAVGELPPLPHTTYNGYSDGSEPLYTAEQMQDYARAALQPAQTAPLTELRGRIKDMQDAAYTYGDHSKEAVDISLDGVIEEIDALLAQGAAPSQDGERIAELEADLNDKRETLLCYLEHILDAKEVMLNVGIEQGEFPAMFKCLMQKLPTARADGFAQCCSWLEAMHNIPGKHGSQLGYSIVTPSQNGWAIAEAFGGGEYPSIKDAIRALQYPEQPAEQEKAGCGKCPRDTKYGPGVCGKCLEAEQPAALSEDKPVEAKGAQQ